MTPRRTRAGPAPTSTALGLTVAEYGGGKSTLCPGCGHDAITGRSSGVVRDGRRAAQGRQDVGHRLLVQDARPTSSNRSHGFNAVHGRMPAVATGARSPTARSLALGVSGDGDTASIGIGQFVHLVRRNVPMVYIIENNGVYGLTKGQFSATADLGTKLKTGVVNDLPADRPLRDRDRAGLRLRRRARSPAT